MPLSEDVHFDGQDYEVGILNEALRVVRTQNHMQHELGLHNMAGKLVWHGHNCYMAN